MRWVESSDLIGMNDIARRSGVGPSAVCNWSTRHEGFPEAVAIVGGRPVFLWSEVEGWLKETGRL